jgi:hypothetical protein
MERYQERVDDLMQNHDIESSEPSYYLSQRGGGMSVEDLNSPNGGFPPLYKKSHDDRMDKTKIVREYTNQKNVVPISEIMKKRRDEAQEPFIFVDEDEGEENTYEEYEYYEKTLR